MKSSLRILTYLLLIVVIFVAGTTGTYILGHYYNGFNIRINSVLDAAYFTTITISTVGYGDIVPVTNAARLFVMAIIITGIGVFLSAITFITGEFVNSRAGSAEGKVSAFEKRLFSNHVILVGTDSVNMRLAEKLKAKNERFIVLTSDLETHDHLRELGYKAYVVDETNEDDMMKFEFNKAKSVIIDMRNKSNMVYAILVVRGLAEKSKIAAIAHSKDEEVHIRSMGAGVGVLSPSDMVSDILMEKIQEL